MKNRETRRRQALSIDISATLLGRAGNVIE
jgi:hypothetical protein